MDFSNQIRPRKVQDLRTILLPHPIALEVEGKGMQRSPHRAIKDDNPFPHQIKKWPTIHSQTAPAPRVKAEQV
jgi:hypothetical protein